MNNSFARLNVVWLVLGILIGFSPTFLSLGRDGTSRVNCYVNVSSTQPAAINLNCPKCPDLTCTSSEKVGNCPPVKECPGLPLATSCNTVDPMATCGNFHVAGTLSPKPEICSYLSLRCRGANHQFGTTSIQPFGMMAMGHGDLMFMDFISARYPHLANFTELGTAAGITTFYFGVTARLRGGNVHTYDIEDKRNPAAAPAWLDNMVFYKEDVLSTVNPKVVASLSRSVQIALLDNGNKKHETNTYIQYLPVGSVMLTHDWDSEIFWTDIQDEIGKRGFEKLHEDFAQYFGSHVRAFIRTSKGSK